MIIDNINDKKYQYENKCYSSEQYISNNLFKDETDKICYNSCKNNVYSRIYGYQNLCYTSGDLSG